MNSEYTIGKIRIPFTSRGRRRWFVGVFYVVIAGYLLAMLSAYAKETSVEWIVAGCGVLFVALWIVFTWIAGNPSARGDERETHRRDHAHYMAYRVLAFCILAAVLAGNSPSPNPITAHLPVVVRSLCMQLPKVLLWATFFVSLTLPQAILLWTEPDMDVSADRKAFRRILDREGGEAPRADDRID